MDGRLVLILALFSSLAVVISATKRISSSHSKELKTKPTLFHALYNSGEEYKPKYPTCQAPEDHASIFIGRDVIIDDDNGAIKPVNKYCACKAGTQYAYKAINPKYDFSALRTTRNLVTGRLRCVRQEDLVVETADGQVLHGVKGQYVDVQPVPYTNRQGKTRVYLTVVVRGSNIENGWATVDETTLNWSIWFQNELSGESVAWETLNNGTAVTRRLNFAEYPFIPIIGVDCNGGRKPIKYCDKDITKTYAR